MSKDRAWMPLHVGDLVSDTMHLGATEFGIYMRLILHCWQHGTIPSDGRKLALIAHCDTRLWHQHEQTVLQFFDVVDASTMQHKRVSAELRRTSEIRSKRKAAAMQMHMQRRSKTDANNDAKRQYARASHNHNKNSSFGSTSEQLTPSTELLAFEAQKRPTPSNGGSLASAPDEGALREPPIAKPEEQPKEATEKASNPVAPPSQLTRSQYDAMLLRRHGL